MKSGRHPWHPDRARLAVNTAAKSGGMRVGVRWSTGHTSRVGVPLVLTALLFACAPEEGTRSDAPAPGPERPAETPEEPEGAEERPREPLTDDLGRRFPLEGFEGDWFCDVVWVSYPVLRPRAEPQEAEESGKLIRLGRSPHAPTNVTVQIEGCSFFVSSIPPPRGPNGRNPEAWNLGPNRCGPTRYSDGFLLLHEWEEQSQVIDSLPNEPMRLADITYTQRELVAQISGIRGESHVFRTYSCHERRGIR